MGQGKSPWYTHRLMHRKRVTCELHDSYFHLMTIKHAIPKIEWGQEVSELEFRWVGERCGRESHHPAEGALGAPSSFGDLLVIRCCRESQQNGPPDLRLSSPGERERHTAMSGRAGEVNMLQSLFGLQLPLIRKPCNKLRGIFFLKSLRSSFINVSICIPCI